MFFLQLDGKSMYTAVIAKKMHFFVRPFVTNLDIIALKKNNQNQWINENTMDYTSKK